jgi:hypothetical protein
MCSFLICFGMGLTVMAPATLTAAAAVEPVPNLTRLVGNALEMAAAASLSLCAYSVIGPEFARRRRVRVLAVLGGCVTTMLVSLVAGHTRFTIDFVDVYSFTPAIVVYESVFFTFIGGCLVLFALVVHRYTTNCDHPPLRRAARTLIVAAGISVVWVGWSGVRPLITITTGRPLDTTVPVGSIIGIPAVGTWLAGLTLMAWASYLTRPVHWLRSYLAYRAVGPLRAAVAETMPGRTAPGRIGWNPGFALWRRVIEIRDGQFALRSHTHPDVPDWTISAARRAGVTDEVETSALVEAAALAGALERWRAGVTANPTSASGPVASNRIEPTVTAEAEALTRVARAFTGSPIVAAVRDRVRQELDQATEPATQPVGPALPGPRPTRQG